MDYLSYIYTPQQMSGGATFAHGTRVGNWSEDMELQAMRVRDYLAKKQAGTLAVNRLQARLATHLRPVEISPKAGGDAVRLGDSLLLWSHHAESFLGADLNDTVTSSLGESLQAVSATKYSYPCARTALTIVPLDAALVGSSLKYGHEFRLCYANLDAGGPLFMFSSSRTPTNASKYSGLGEVLATKKVSHNTVWRVQNLDPSYRMETEGEDVPANAPVVLCHAGTNTLLGCSGVAFDNDFSIEHGDTEVVTNTYLPVSKYKIGNREHQLNGSENHFVFVSAAAPAAAVADGQ